METGIIFNIQKFCLHDGDGIRTCVFLKGCPLRCIWCHNPESIDKSPELSFDISKCSSCGRCLDICSVRSISDGIMNIDRKMCTGCGKCSEVCINDANDIIGKEMTATQVFTEVMKDRMFYETSGGGMTVTGGEPSYQTEFTLELLRLAKENGISSAIETCGIGTREFYKKAADLGATFLFDIKCISPERHHQLTGADNSHIMSNFHYLSDRNADIILRLPLIPGCNDSDGDIAQLSEFLNNNKSRYRYAEIMPYHSLGTAKATRTGKVSSYTHADAGSAEKERWLSLFAFYGTDVKISE